MIPHSRSVRNSSLGFSLVELLVTIVIIAVLCAIIMATLRLSRVSAQKAQSISNLHQIGTAAQLLAIDKKGRIPAISSGGFTWYVNIWRYIASSTTYPSEGVMRNSVVWRPGFDGSPNQDLGYGVGYGWNLNLTEANGYTFQSITSPGKKILSATVLKGNGLWPGGDWNCIVYPYGEKAGILYLDGHVDLVASGGVNATTNISLP